MEGRISTHINLQHKSKLKYKFPKGSCTRTLLKEPRLPTIIMTSYVPRFLLVHGLLTLPPLVQDADFRCDVQSCRPPPRYIVHPRSAEGSLSWTALKFHCRRLWRTVVKTRLRVFDRYGPQLLKCGWDGERQCPSSLPFRLQRFPAYAY